MSGDVFRLTSWTHVQPNMRVTLHVRDKRSVAVMLHLGEEPKDGSQPLDLLATMKRMGWKPATREFEAALKQEQRETAEDA
jgi:hypothetical protein